MKKVFLFLFCLLCGFMTVHADDLTGKALTMRGQIKSFIAEEGYTPSIDSDGDVMFKYEGDKYWVTMENYADGVYFQLFTVTSISDANINRVRRAADEAQRNYKFVRCNVGERSVTVECVAYIQSIAEFRQLFPRYLNIVSSTDRMMGEEYNAD